MDFLKVIFVFQALETPTAQEHDNSRANRQSGFLGLSSIRNSKARADRSQSVKTDPLKFSNWSVGVQSECDWKFHPTATARKIEATGILDQQAKSQNSVRLLRRGQRSRAVNTTGGRQRDDAAKRADTG